MSKVVKYYYSSPVYKATIMNNPILNKTVVSKVRHEKRYTMAAVFDDVEKTIKFGLSICMPQDNFCKAIGRQIAEKNAIEKPFHIIEGFSGRRNDYADEVMQIMVDKEARLLKHNNPNLFNPKYFTDDRPDF